ncbi:phosphoribosylglycinamide formyltransferase [Solitalea canadensis]|uniref:Phosphoribosylglycinamide formyltransferase n=1 Tax=Solitalea canadensis (strain ATCC 29591 / DSM 3403 / JCM 21819 / LMG 8368 / NBRC 15130 / NCIMB 12057 / USAM 9D) TaxID=929556 RepID=H8KXT3_SOLCM|nr:phosphoribosylglycinamide formyltransferase [Solitalea canadensis]AFD05498.1 phosphoribosylglycinamide formyltransferase, formyltetrahydrofolate-dependent [Solitalea canadensis DSM 3403]
MKRIAIFASGSGSNAQKIIEYFHKNQEIEVSIVLSNRPDAYVLQRADNFEIPTHVFDREEFYQTNEVVKLLQSLNIDLVVLAGFLWLVPSNLIEAYPNKIINIHPAILPKFGGKGMYGMKVHKAVLEAGEAESGITIHFVNEHFDEGEIIHQSKYKIDNGDDIDMIAYKGQQLEHHYYPKVIENLLKKMSK